MSLCANFYRRPFGVEQEYIVQLFVEHDQSLKLPTVGNLLEIMFKEQKIRFTKVLYNIQCRFVISKVLSLLGRMLSFSLCAGAI